VVVSMTCLERGHFTVEHIEEGYKTHKALQWERQVDVISEACAQGAFFGMYQGVSDGGDRGTRPGLILYSLY
jgi:hypothetical protein